MAKCPKCGDPRAEISFTRAYCPNQECDQFDSDTLAKVVAQEEEDWEESYGPHIPLIYPDWYFGDDYISH